MVSQFASNVPGIIDKLRDFATLVQAASELVRGNVPLATQFGGRLEGISFEAGRLLVETGVVNDLDEGIVIFHERITRDKPGLRKVLRDSDRRAGRLKRVRRSKAQRAMALAVKSGQVKRDKNGKFKGLTPAATRQLKRIKSREASARRKKDILRQQRFAAKLRGF